MKRVTTEQVHALKLAELGLTGKSTVLTSDEAIAAALRRAAGLLCPCSPRTLVRVVTGPLEALVDDVGVLADRVEEMTDALLSFGDLIESRELLDEESNRRRVVYAAPPAFVARSNGGVLLIGVAPDGLSPLTAELSERVEVSKHVRCIPSGPDDARGALAQLGLLELQPDAWLKAPAAEPAQHMLARYDGLLDRAGASGAMPELVVLDPTEPVRYYRGRWSAPKALDGRYVGRRTQAYGADLWCYVELRAGEAERFIDLPPAQSRWRGCDDAWRLQMAIDAVRGSPQLVRATARGEGTLLEVFSPVPMWCRRRWDALGDPVEQEKCLFAYMIPTHEISEELRFAEQMLWLTRVA